MTEDGKKTASEARSGGQPPEPTTLSGAIVKLLHPITLTVMLILVGVTLLIAAAVLGLDSGGVLPNMASHEFARGLITYLFAVTTIGTSVVLVLGALMKEIDEKAFQRGKEVLGLLLGVFGTIVGFYFGSEAGAAGQRASLDLSESIVSEAAVSAGDTVTVISAVRGGTPPYRYAVGTGSAAELDYARTAGPGGLVSATFVAPAVDSETEVRIILGVMDGSNEVAIRESTLRVSPRPGGG